MTLYTLAQLGHAPRSETPKMPSGSESSSDESDDAAPRRKRPPKSPLERHLPLTPASVNEVTKLINEASAEAEHDLGDNESPAQASVQRQLDALLGMMPKGAAPRTATEDAAI